MATCHGNLIDVAAILDFMRNIKKFSQATHFLQSSKKLAQMIFRPSLMKVIPWRFDFRKCMSVRANQIQRRSRQTGSEVISLQRF